MKIKIKTAVQFATSVLIVLQGSAQSDNTCTSRLLNENKMIEIRSYNLKPGTRKQFNSLFVDEALPLLRKWKAEVVSYGPSMLDEDSYFLVRSYKDLANLQQSEDAFYGSDDWRKGPREAILALIENYTTIVLPASAADQISKKIMTMEVVTSPKTDSQQLSDLNARFIKNFIRQDVASHNEIIHRNFICIESDGSVVDRATYMKNWSTDFTTSGYTSFSYGDEQIRIFNDMALVRSITTYTKTVYGKNIRGHSIYTDTYIKENGRWWCVQAHITPVKDQ